MSCKTCNECQRITGANIKDIDTLQGLDESGCVSLEKPDHFICRILNTFPTGNPLYVGDAFIKAYGNDCKFHTLDITPEKVCEKLSSQQLGATSYIGSGLKFYADDCKKHPIDFTGLYAHTKLKELPAGNPNEDTSYIGIDGSWHKISQCDTARPIASGSPVLSNTQGCLVKAPAPIAYHKSSSQNVANGTATVINYENKKWDSSNNVTTGSTWAYTAPVTGVYHVSASTVIEQLALDINTSDSTPNVAIQVYINGSLFSKLAQTNTSIKFPKIDGTDFARQDFYHVSGGRDILLNAGDKLDIRVSVSMKTGGTTRILDDTTFAQYNNNEPLNENYFTIHYVGAV